MVPTFRLLYSIATDPLLSETVTFETVSKSFLQGIPTYIICYIINFEAKVHIIQKMCLTHHTCFSFGAVLGYQLYAECVRKLEI